jgi:hypothetical protein
MTQGRPVLVVHGVGNRDNEAGFHAQVQALQRGSDHLELIPVFWGDLAADPRYILPTLPDISAAEVRSAEGVAGDPALGLALLEPVVEVRDETGWRVIADAAVREEVRADPAAAEETRAAIAEVWHELSWLPRVADDALLRHAGEVVAAAEPDDGTAERGGTFEVRGGEEGRVETRWLGSRVRDVVRDTLLRVDELVGELVGQVGGRLNRALRSSLGPGIVGFAGDIVAYEHEAEKVRERLWDTIAKHAAGLGTAEQPIGAVGHSLGGVILVDAAVATDRPLHLDGLVTFGSQSPFFHAINPRSSLVPRFEDAGPVTLPSTLSGRWVNLWEPLDLLAFVASEVFRLADGGAPEDRIVPYQTSSGLWTHSAYWQLPELGTALRDVFS